MGVFAKAVETGSFSAAGDVLGMSSQLVGKHVQTLEQHLGIRLLQRTTRRQHLTEAGRDFYERVKIILAEVEAAEGVAAISGATPRGRLRINAPVTFGVHALAPRLSEYLRQYPDVTIDMALSNRYVDLIDEGFDVIFRVGELADSGLMARALSPYRLCLCAAPAYLATCPPITHPRDIEQLECLGFSHSDLHSRWTFEGVEGPITVPISGKLRVDNGEALLMVARAGMGLLMQAYELVQADLACGSLVPVLPDFPVPARPFHVLYAPDRRMTPKLRSFLDFTVAHFGAGRAS